MKNESKSVQLINAKRSNFTREALRPRKQDKGRGINSLILRKIEPKLPYRSSRENIAFKSESTGPIDDIWIGDKRWTLYIPIYNRAPNSNAMDLIATLQDMDLTATVSVSLEYNEENLQFLRHCVDPMTTAAEPYLEVLIRGCSAFVLHFRGDEIIQELKQIHH